MSNIAIVKLPPEDWQRFREIRLEALREEPQAFGTAYAEMAEKPPDYWQGRLAEALRSENSWLVFALEGERLVGMAGAVREAERQAAHIIAVYVSKTVRGRGAGRALLEATLAEVGEAAGIRVVRLGVNAGQQAAVRLYLRHGFQITEEKDEMQGDGQMHRGYRMEMRLP